MTTISFSIPTGIVIGFLIVWTIGVCVEIVKTILHQVWKKKDRELKKIIAGVDK